ncbi:MAG TPA: efflux RND transporter permease subunit [Candidatus Moranbacteria bacterium]|nr:efflux RND transporter permease subunit [Candidatus Moranbacteria bacterium]
MEQDEKNLNPEKEVNTCERETPVFLSSDSAYLEKLEFDPALRKTWLNFFVSNFRVVVLMIFLLSGWGIYSFLKLPRESNPEVKIPYAIVTTVFPGASPSDVEELVTKKLETDISSLKGIKKITSSSTNSFSAISVEFNTSENQDDSLRNLRDKVSAVKDLPLDADDPQVSEISFDDEPIFTFSFSGPYDGFTLRTLAEKLQDELEKIPDIREVSVSGGDEKEFLIAYSPKKLSFYGISTDEANQAVSSLNHVVPGGNFEGVEFNYPVRVDGRFFDAEKLRKIPVKQPSGSNIVYLGDIAEVSEKNIKKTIYSRSSSGGKNPQNAITISLVKKTGGSIIGAVDEAKKTIEAMNKTFPPGITYEITTDFSELIRKDFQQLTHDFVLTLILVFGILFLIVGLKEAVVAGMAIPLVFFATFGIMLETGTSLNFLSIFSLLLSLGLLVDDAIVVVSATKQYLKTGKYTPEEAVLLVLRDFKVVLASTTLATTWAFLPLLLSTGIIGAFIKSIPITVSVTLIASLFIALAINHPLAAVLERIRLTKKFFLLILFGLLSAFAFFIYLDTFWNYIFGAFFAFIFLWLVHWYEKGGQEKLENNKILSEKEWNNDDLIKEKLRTQGSRENSTFGSRLIHGIIHFDKVIPIYEKYLKKAICTRKSRAIVLISTALLFISSILLPILGIVPTEFFSATDENNLYINIEAPTGLNLDETDKITKKIEEKLLKYKEIKNFSTIVGKPGISPSGGGAQISNGSSNFSSITVTLVDSKEREITSYDLAKKIREDFSDIQEAEIAVESARGGPPSGTAFEARIIGDDLQKLDKIATDLKPVLSSISGVVDIKSSLKDAPAEYTFLLDPIKLSFYDLNALSVGSAIRTAISKLQISTIILDNKEIEVNATFNSKEIPTLEALQNLEIINFKGQPVFIKDVAKVELKPSVDTITRIDQKRAVLLSAGVEGKTRPNSVLSEFQKKLETDYKLPDGYSIVYGGENEQNAESVVSILRAMIIAGILIISTLIIQFNSFKKAMIVLTTLPLALIGVFYGLAIFGVSLSFPGLIGILALFGIVVKNAIILIDKINLNIKFGIPFYDSIIDAGKSRLEAIFITSIATIFGLIPITFSNATWMALGSAVIFGLMFSSFLTLFVVPLLYVSWISEKEKF